MRMVALFAILGAGAASMAGCEREEAPPPPPVQEPGELAPREVGTGADPADEELSEAAREVIDRYERSMEELAEVLQGIDDRVEAIAASPRVKELVEQMRGYMQELEAMTPETRAAARELYEQRVAPVVGEVRAEGERLREYLEDLPRPGRG